MQFTNAEKHRYSRQIVLSGFSMKGQELLKDCSVLIVGCGGLGSVVSMYLCGAGVGRIGLLDGDIVDIPNLHRQIIHSEDTVGKKKVTSALQKLEKLNSTIKIEYHDCTLDSAYMAAKIFEFYDVIVDCTDSVHSRYVVNDGAVMCGKPVVFASAVCMSGQLSVFNYHSGPCYRCFVPNEPPLNTQTKAADVGVLGPIVGAMGALQALETLKVIVGKSLGSCLVKRMLLFNGLNLSTRIVRLGEKKKDCPSCGAIQHLSGESHFSEYKTFNDDGITIEFYKNLAEKGTPVTIIDVRPAHEYAIAAIDNSLSVPLNDLNSWKLPDEISSFILVVCRRGYDSQTVVHLLKKDKDKSINCKYLIGGLHMWKQVVNPSFPLY